MIHYLRSLFNRYWYSLCSAHRKYDKNCDMCQGGSWVTEREIRKSKRWYKEHHYDGYKWVENDKRR